MGGGFGGSNGWQREPDVSAPFPEAVSAARAGIEPPFIHKDPELAGAARTQK
jgi:hypothetical protein